MKKTKILNLTTLLLIALPNLLYALPAEQNQLLLQTGISKRVEETAFSYSVSWKKNDDDPRRSNGLTFINGTDSNSPHSAIDIAKKITKAINAGVIIESPHDRGATAKQTPNKPELLVGNQAGFDLTHITVRDYTNQELYYSVPNNSFKSASMVVAIDFVYSAAVEYVKGFSSNIKQQTMGGFVTVTIDDNSAIKITTTGKSNRDIEKELALAIGSGASFSSTPIYPNFTVLRSKNYKSFDGGEVQLPALNARSIRIDVNDAGLGVLTKFKFVNTNKKTESTSQLPYIIALIIIAFVAYLFYGRQKNV